jgi:hypothetical protein
MRCLFVYFLDVFFNPEDGGSTFLRKFGKLLVLFEITPVRIKNGQRQRRRSAEYAFVSSASIRPVMHNETAVNICQKNVAGVVCSAVAGG